MQTNPCLLGKRNRRLCGEALEPRHLLAADLAIDSAYLLDSSEEEVEQVFAGASVVVRVDFSEEGVEPNAQYAIRFEMDGIPLEQTRVVDDSSSPLFRVTHAGYAKLGVNTVSVFLDPGNLVEESNEDNNRLSFSFTASVPPLTQKLELPLAGEQHVDWTLTYYVDDDLRVGAWRDHQDGFLTYDGHVGTDFFLPGFPVMDAGIPVYAAASGVVKAVYDGAFDREENYTGSASRNVNFVVLEHEDGWETVYDHLQLDSVAVVPGDVVAAGQTIGAIGSSGVSNAPHLHFELRHEGRVVNPIEAPSDYFVDPPAYTGLLTPVALSVGITDRDPITDFMHRPSEIRVFQLGGMEQVHVHYFMPYARAGAPFVIEWLRPDGALHKREEWTSSRDVPFVRMRHYNEEHDVEGEWTVKVSYAGVPIVQETYHVSSVATEPEIQLRHKGIFMTGGRTTPIDFGAKEPGESTTEEFLLQNVGTGPLVLSEIRLPEGFRTNSSLSDVTVLPDESIRLEIEMTANRVGEHLGEFLIISNDRDESEFVLPIVGTVNGSPNSNAPRLTGPSHALAIEEGATSAYLFDEVTLNAGSQDLWPGNSTLQVHVFNGVADRSNDRIELRFKNGNWAAFDDRIFYGQEQIGVFESRGEMGELTLDLVNAELWHIQQVIEAISFRDASRESSFRKRTVTLQVLGPRGLESNLYHRSVFYGRENLNHPPVIDAISSLVIPENTNLGALPFGIADYETAAEDLTVVAVSSNQVLLPNEQLEVEFADGSWQVAGIPQAEQVGTTLIRIVATDWLGASSTTVFELRVVSSWQNPADIFDVNDDSFVSAVDALLIINYINESGSVQLDDDNAPAGGPYYDASGDDWVSAIDALMVINRLNRLGNAEGEEDWGFDWDEAVAGRLATHSCEEQKEKFWYAFG